MKLCTPPSRGRRWTASAAASLTLFGVAATAASPAAAAATSARLTLPAPTGPDRLGTVSLHLRDTTRADPLRAGRFRELMISIWYPALDTTRYPVAPWIAPAAAPDFEAGLGIPPGTVALPLTHGHTGAPADNHAGSHPVLIYSPGYGYDRAAGTTQVEDLASHGYIVVTIDHTYDAAEVAFPDGTVTVRHQPADTPEARADAVVVREADTEFVLTELEAIKSGENPSVEHQPLPRGLGAGLNLGMIGMFGHSIGGATTASVMHADPRVKAGVDLDGSLYGPVVSAGLEQPFMIMSRTDHGRDTDQSWASIWNQLRGAKYDLQFAGTQHDSFTDLEILVSQAAPLLHLPTAQVAAEIGTASPRRTLMAERAYVRAFFDLQLRHWDEGLLSRRSGRYPEAGLVP